MNVQIIVISANEERKQYIIKQFKDLSVPYPIHFLAASTPANSQEYFNGSDCDDRSKKNICCSRSHCRAIEYAGLSSSPEYSIIVEDDIALHKTKFLPVVEELRLEWDNKIPSKVEYVSLGWIMMSTHDEYSKRCKPAHLVSSPETGWHDWYVVGLQAYMMKREVAARIAPVINKPTFIELGYSITSKNHQDMKRHEDCIAADKFLPRLLISWVLFPSLAIECESFSSLLDHNNFTQYWNKYFADREDDKLLYYNPMNVQIIVISASEERKRYMKKQFKDLSVPYPVYFLEASTPATSQEYYTGMKLFGNIHKRLCCGRSHCRAIEYAGLSSSPEYSIIVEDDVALHKTKCIPIVEELRLEWNKKIPSNVDYVSLGWIMFSKHDEYKKRCKPLHLASSPETGWHDWFVWGLQAYMIKRDSASKIAPIINKPTFIEMNKSILSQNYRELKDPPAAAANPENTVINADLWKTIPIDYFLPRILYPWIIYPAIAIECESLTSLLEHNNFTIFWNKYFADREGDKLLYYSPT